MNVYVKPACAASSGVAYLRFPAKRRPSSEHDNWAGSPPFGLVAWGPLSTAKRHREHLIWVHDSGCALALPAEDLHPFALDHLGQCSAT